MDSQRPAVIGDFDELYHITVRQWRMREYEHVPWRNRKTPHKHTQKNKTIPETKPWWWKHCWILRTWRLIWWHERRSIIKNSSINRTTEIKEFFFKLSWIHKNRSHLHHCMHIALFLSYSKVKLTIEQKYLKCHTIFSQKPKSSS